MTTPDIRVLESEIERLVREHVDACRVAAQAAIERGFASARKDRNAATLTRTPKATKPRSTPSAPRTPEQIAELGERFYLALCKKPGETMGVLAAQIDVSANELRHPVALLKRAGRVRSVGQRYQTRYFPMVSDSSVTTS